MISSLPGPHNNVNTPSGLSDEFFTVSATIANFNSAETKVGEASGSLNVPVQKQVKLNVNEFHRKVKNVVWKVNGKQIGGGNDLNTTFQNIGLNKLSVSFKETESGRQHDRDFDLYTFRQKFLSVTIVPQSAICGKVAIGVKQTLTSFSNEVIGPGYEKTTVQDICQTHSNYTARIARLPVSIYDTKATLSIDLIEPSEIKSDNSITLGLLFFWIKLGATTRIVPRTVYQTVDFPASITNDLGNGTYTSGNVTLKIEE